MCKELSIVLEAVLSSYSPVMSNMQTVGLAYFGCMFHKTTRRDNILIYCFGVVSAL